MYFRQGVTSSELSGKTWKLISVPRDGDRSHSSASANSVQRWRSLSDHTNAQRHKIWRFYVEGTYGWHIHISLMAFTFNWKTEVVRQINITHIRNNLIEIHAQESMG